MNEQFNDAGVIAVLVERVEKQRIPRVLALKEKVARGELLDDFDIEFLEEVFQIFPGQKELLDRHPEYHDLVARLASLYADIMKMATENEKKHQTDHKSLFR